MSLAHTLMILEVWVFMDSRIIQNQMLVVSFLPQMDIEWRLFHMCDDLEVETTVWLQSIGAFHLVLKLLDALRIDNFIQTCC